MLTHFNGKEGYLVSMPDPPAPADGSPTYPVTLRTRLTKAQLEYLTEQVEAAAQGLKALDLAIVVANLLPNKGQGSNPQPSRTYSLTEKGKRAAAAYRREMERKGERFNGKA